MKLPSCLVFLVATAAAFSVPNHRVKTYYDQHDDATVLSATRRQVVEKSMVAVSALLLGGSQTAFADVSDGTQLPDGAAQFARFIKVKGGIPAVKKRLSSGEELDKAEWNNIGGFLRRIYQEGDDMKAMAKSLSDDKKKQVDVLVEDLKKYTRAGETPVNSQDAKTVIGVLDKSSALLNDFMDLLSDVPDEL